MALKYRQYRMTACQFGLNWKQVGQWNSAYEALLQECTEQESLSARWTALNPLASAGGVQKGHLPSSRHTSTCPLPKLQPCSPPPPAAMQHGFAPPRTKSCRRRWVNRLFSKEVYNVLFELLQEETAVGRAVSNHLLQEHARKFALETKLGNFNASSISVPIEKEVQWFSGCRILLPWQPCRTPCMRRL